MIIRDDRVKPVREKLQALGFRKVAGGVYKRDSDGQTVQMRCPQSPSDQWSTEVNL